MNDRGLNLDSTEMLKGYLIANLPVDKRNKFDTPTIKVVGFTELAVKRKLIKELTFIMKLLKNMGFQIKVTSTFKVSNLR